MNHKVEFKKEVSFDEVQVGDLISVEIFDEHGNFMAERRGTAQVCRDGMWIFEDMYPVYRTALGFALYKIMPEVDLLTVESGEYARLISIEVRIREQIDKLETKRGLALGYSKDLRSTWEIERALVWEGKANKYLDKINLLKEVLGDS